MGKLPEDPKILSRPSHERSCFGLLKVMGCRDTAMYLLSEAMCIEQIKLKALDGGNVN